MKYLSLFIIFMSVSVFGSSLFAQNPSESEASFGYAKGSLMAIGGGRIDTAIMMRFKELAGGDAARIVVIPTALGDAYLMQDSVIPDIKKHFEGLGFQQVNIMHSPDTVLANNNDFVKPLKTATGIFFVGGRQWRIADGFLNTKAHQEMFRLLDRGGVVAGTSAGATIQGSYLARGDTKNNQIMMGDHEIGLGFIENVAIDQHVLARNRQFDMFDILKKRPELLGIGIDENTAILVQGDQFEVIGSSYVLIYDQGFWSREGSELKNLPPKDHVFYMLKAGDRYDMRKRAYIEP